MAPSLEANAIAIVKLVDQVRINAEEHLLHSQFGDNYDAYRSQTRSLISRMYK